MLPSALRSRVAAASRPSSLLAFSRSLQTSSVKPAASSSASPALNAGQELMEKKINEYTPGGPVLIGTVNDATTFPPPSKSHGSQHWQFERLLCVALVPLTATSFMLSTSAHPIFDGVLGATLVLHSHIGFDASLTDYLHKRKFPVLGPACAWFIRAASVGALWGVYEFNTNDVGLTQVVANLWKA